MHDAHVHLFKQRQLIADVMIAALPIWLEARKTRAWIYASNS